MKSMLTSLVLVILSLFGNIQDSTPIAHNRPFGLNRSAFAMTSPVSSIHELLPYQAAWVNDPSRFKIWLASRQVGKSQAAVVEAVRDCIAHPGTMWVILSAGLRQSLETFQKAAEYAERFDAVMSDYCDVPGLVNRKMKVGEITWSNGSRLLALPANPNTARGYSANIILDEFAFQADSGAIWKSLYPSISNPLRGVYKIRIISTANGRQNTFFDLWTKPVSQSTITRYQRHFVTIQQAVAQGLSGSIDPEAFIAELRSGLNDQLAWQQEFECHFTDGQETLLPYELILQAESPQATTNDIRYLTEKTGPIFCGIDFGRSVDPTVCWVLEQVGDVLVTREVLLLRAMTTVAQNEILRPRILRSTRTAIDSTGPGVGFGDCMAKESRDKVLLCSFNLPFKRLLFPRMARRFQAPVSVRIPSSPEIREDLHGIQQTLVNGDYQYTALRSATGHSDRAIALALAIHVASDFEPAPAPAQFIPMSPSRFTTVNAGRRFRVIPG